MPGRAPDGSSGAASAARTPCRATATFQRCLAADYGLTEPELHLADLGGNESRVRHNVESARNAPDGRIAVIDRVVERRDRLALEQRDHDDAVHEDGADRIPPTDMESSPLYAGCPVKLVSRRHGSRLPKNRRVRVMREALADVGVPENPARS